MAKTDRLERLDVRRVGLETEYLEALIAALQLTAGGCWGLFGHNQDRWTRANAAPVIENLTEMGQAIDGIRGQLGMGPFALHLEFMASRGPVVANEVGEPKQALAWLEKLGLHQPADDGSPLSRG